MDATDVSAKVVSIFCTHRARDIVILPISTRCGTDFDHSCWNFNIGEERNRLINVHFALESWAIDVSVKAGVVAIQKEVLEERANKGRYVVVYFIAIASRKTLGKSTDIEGFIRSVETHFEDRVGLSVGWPIFSIIASQRTIHSERKGLSVAITGGTAVQIVIHI